MSRVPRQLPCVRVETDRVKIEGPNGHPLAQVRLRWREDGSLVIEAPGPIAICASDLRQRPRGMVAVEKAS